MIIKKSIEGLEGNTGVMPPKGGNENLSTADITHAVTYMIGTVK